MLDDWIRQQRHLEGLLVSTASTHREMEYKVCFSDANLAIGIGIGRTIASNNEAKIGIKWQVR